MNKKALIAIVLIAVFVIGMTSLVLAAKPDKVDNSHKPIKEKPNAPGKQKKTSMGPPPPPSIPVLPFYTE